jgi:hypothetical protein
MNVSFPVHSRYGGQHEPVTIEVDDSYKLTTQQRVVLVAGENCWAVELGYEVALNHQSGSVVFVKANRQAHVEFGVKGQIIYLRLKDETEGRVENHRFATLHSFLTEEV